MNKPSGGLREIEWTSLGIAFGPCGAWSKHKQNWFERSQPPSSISQERTPRGYLAFVQTPVVSRKRLQRRMIARPPLSEAAVPWPSKVMSKSQRVSETFMMSCAKGLCLQQVGQPIGSTCALNVEISNSSPPSLVFKSLFI